MKLSRKSLFFIFIPVAAIATLIIWQYRSGQPLEVPGLAPRKTPKIRLTRNLTDDELKTVVVSLRQSPANVSDPKPLVALGQKFFFDKRFSANGQIACASCHDPQRSFTDGKATAEGLTKTAMNAPTLINSYAGEWFFWNGRADSLEAQALGPVENPKEHGFSRGKVVGVIREKYRSDYEKLFGPLPDIAADFTKLPPPSQKQSLVSSSVAAYALATLGSDPLQKKILRQAQSISVQPVEVLKTMTAAMNEPPTAFEKIDLGDQISINLIFANFGKALAAYERTIRTLDSPFDRYVDRLKTAPTPEEAFGDGFQAAELRGLRLFTGRGNCTLCHHGSQLTDQQFHNIGMMALSAETLDLGRAQGLLDARDSEFNCKGSFLKQSEPRESCRELEFLETESAEAVGAFKTPTLRNLNDTAPYGHDGRFPNLDSILQHYNHLAVPPAVGHIEESLAPLGFTEAELKDLQSFLLSISSPISYFKGE